MTMRIESSSKTSEGGKIRSARRSDSRMPKYSAMLFEDGSGHIPAAVAVAGVEGSTPVEEISTSSVSEKLNFMLSLFSPIWIVGIGTESAERNSFELCLL